MVVSINEAIYKKDYKIEFHFSDGLRKEIDFAHFLGTANNPMTKKYLDKKIFQKFKLEYGDIIWNDYEMCFPVWDLHEGTL